MCGRKTLTKGKLEIIEALFVDDWQMENYAPNYNVAPGQIHPVMIHENSKKIVKGMHWGLIPAWQNMEYVHSPQINARMESLGAKASFRHLLDDRRCVVLADGYYEWHTENRIPYFIHHPDNDMICMAGLYDIRNNEQITYTIITTPAPESLSMIHPRTPFILSITDYDRWLDPALAFDKLERTIKPACGHLAYYSVSKLINNVKNNSPELLAEFHYDNGNQLNLF